MLFWCYWAMACIDRYDMRSSVAAEHVSRRILQIQTAARRSPKNPDFDGTTLFIGQGPVAEASVSIQDEIRPTSFEAVSLLADMGLEVILLSGDSHQVAEQVADQLNIIVFLGSIDAA